MLKLSNINKSFQQGENKIDILKNINLEIEKEDYVSIMGPSGSGKSTLMNLIGCLDTPTSGNLFVDQKDVTLLKENQLSDLRNNTISFVFQNFNLLSEQTALQNVELPLVYRKVSKAERTMRAKEALVKVGLEDRLHFKPKELSGGQMQRVAIARALITDAPLILADEPTGALDTITSEQIMDLFSELNVIDKKTILVITHEMEVAEYSKRLILVRDGEIERDFRKVDANND